ncbi:MAG: LPS export ABC transporter periplasmic protein LptC [Pseudomonadota bacterium]
MHAQGSRAATLFPLLLAGLLAGMTYWLDLASRQQPVTDGKSRHDPDYMIENFQVRRFGPEGNLQNTLRAAEMRHYPDDDSTWIRAPDLTYHRVPPSHVTSREAFMDSEGKHVELVGDVRVTRGATDGKPETVLTTSRLDAWPDDEIASNKEPVTIVQGLSNVHGSRMQANNKTAIYVLEGPVNGIFYRQAATVAADPSPRAATPPQAKPVVKAQPKAKAKPVKKTKARAKPKPKSKPKAKPQPKR